MANDELTPNDLEPELQRVGATWQAFVQLVRENQGPSGGTGPIAVQLDLEGILQLLRSLPDGAGQEALLQAYKAAFAEPVLRKMRTAEEAERKRGRRRPDSLVSSLARFALKSDIPLQTNGRLTAETLLDDIERGLREYDAEIVDRGDCFLTFRVPIGERIVRHLNFRAGGWGPWWPFDFVSFGTLNLAAATNGIALSGEIETSQWFLVPAAFLAIACGFVAPLPSTFLRTLVGVLVGITLSGGFLALGRWQFRSWLHRLVDDSLSS
jgi:hypothetical protein